VRALFIGQSSRNDRGEGEMPMHFDQILTVNLICSTVIFYVGAKIYILPKIEELKPQAILVPILILHSLRHLGLMFLTRGATHTGMPSQFAYPAAIGDFVTAVLAFIAIPVTVRKLDGWRFLIWAFNIVGTIDLITAITLATVHGSSAYMGAAYWIPAFWVPALLVTHYVVFIVLIRQPVEAPAS
jgi:hypothetical protein